MGALPRLCVSAPAGLTPAQPPPEPGPAPANRDPGSTFTPGPMVEETATRLM